MAREQAELDTSDIEIISSILQVYDDRLKKISLFQDQLLIALHESDALSEQVHSFKSRVKERSHLEDKLERKVKQARAEGRDFEVTPENLLVQINDLAGIRILHLYTRQIAKIDKALRSIFKEQNFSLREGPFARTWDDESREFFESCGIETQRSDTLYTSVHYVVGSASATTFTCEIQVRTLMEEVWGEVDHALNYPHATTSLACREQLKVLARVTSSATRLVDSIFMTSEDHENSIVSDGSDPD